MSETFELNGKCLCGNIQIKANTAKKDISACHCEMCRTWSGGPFIAINCGEKVSIEGDEHIAKYSSSEWAERGFCKQCGTHIFYKLKGTDHYMLSAGLFTATTPFELKMQIFIDEKPQYFSFANDTENLTGAETFERYAPKS